MPRIHEPLYICGSAQVPRKDHELLRYTTGSDGYWFDAKRGGVVARVAGVARESPAKLEAHETPAAGDMMA